MEKTNQIVLILKGKGLSYEKKISEDIATKIMSLCLISRDSIQVDRNQEDVVMSDISKQGIKKSVREYMDEVDPKRNPDKILTFAGYLCEHQDKALFRRNEIKALFQEAHEPIPKNLTRDFDWVITNGWFAPDQKDKRHYYITNTGFEVLSKRFPQDLIKKTRGKSRLQKNKKKTVH